MATEKQIFKPVPGLVLLFAGTWGDVYTMKGSKGECGLPRKLTSHDSNGYRRVYYDNKDHLVHRLVMAAHVGVCDAPVNHIDGNKSNNYIKNLEYCTQGYNVWHYYNVTKPDKMVNLPEHIIEKVESYILATNLTLQEISLELGVYIEDVKKIKKKLDKVS